jgi:hypothetical protein
LPSDDVEFVHNSEHQLARLLDFYGIRWAYEPHTFVLERDADGNVTEAFSPDFHLPEFDRYLEVTTSRQALVTRKNRKVRRVRECYPGIDVQVIYQRDYRHLLVRYGLEPPDQHSDEPAGHSAMDSGPELLQLGVVAPMHPANPRFRRAG